MSRDLTHICTEPIQYDDKNQTNQLLLKVKLYCLNISFKLCNDEAILVQQFTQDASCRSIVVMVVNYILLRALFTKILMGGPRLN